MAQTKVIMPQMGESVAEGTVAKWLKSVGDKIEQDENILEISTDKIDVEVPAATSGFLRAILVQEEETVDVGTVLAIIADTLEETVEGAEAVVAAKPKAEPVAEAVVEAVAEAAPAPLPSGDKRQFYTPVVMRMAAEHNLDLNQITGTGSAGRITKKDVKKFLESGPAKPAPAATPQPVPTAVAPQSAPPAAKAAPITFAPGEDVEVIKMSNVRKKTAEHMVMSKQTSAHVHSMQEVDMTNIVRYRNSVKDEFKKQNGFSLSYMAIITKEVAEAIREFPMINSSVDGDRILVKKGINIGMAVALPDDTLIVPIIKNAAHLSVTGISGSINDLAYRARNKKLTIDDIQGGTFTITNHGIFGSVFGTPIISQPQVAILGTGVMRKMPVVVESEEGDSIAIRTMMYLTLGYDHRIIDGSYGGRFVARIAERLENWTSDRL
jgi:2-oxoglutarate dehydrogenase E2 component (dihydrolipoamide succinyltransferase)